MIHEGASDVAVPNARGQPAYNKWLFSYTDNHWANLSVTKDFTAFCYNNFLRTWMEKKGVDLDTAKREAKGVWMLDCWPVHCSAEFREWVAVECPGFELMCVNRACGRARRAGCPRARARARRTRARTQPVLRPTLSLIHISEPTRPY